MKLFAIFIFFMLLHFTYEHFFRRIAEITTDATCKKRRIFCAISVTSKKEYCKEQRMSDLKTSRKFYKLTKSGEGVTKIIQFPLDDIPFLNQTIQKVVFHTAMDPIDSRWLAQVSTIKTTIEAIAAANMAKATAEAKENMAKAAKENKPQVTPSMADVYKKYFNMHSVNIEQMHDDFKPAQHHFANPAMYSTYTDFIYNDDYLKDDNFVQKRLAGPCPFLIKLVTIDGKVGFHWEILRQHLNLKSYLKVFDAALRRAIGGGIVRTLWDAVKANILYVLYHEDNNDMPTTPDFFDKDRLLVPTTSTITLFVRTASGELKVVAIQWDYKNTAEVYTPQSDQKKWTLAKHMADQGDLNVCQALWHLSHMHISAGVYCTLFKSHLSKLHPLHEIMKYHCEGTTPHISTTYMHLVAPNSIGHQVFSIGNNGYINLAKKGFKKFRYGLLAYDNVLKSHGLDLKGNRRLKYYPFRDDGNVLWITFQNFARQFTAMFYKNDRCVRNDKELQSFANQVSLDGTGDPYGGKGNIPDFPTQFRTKVELQTFITRFLWQIAMHASVNYVLEPWATFIPAYPTKLYYTDPDTKEYSLPNVYTAIAAIEFAALLGNVRVNSIMDYYGGIRHKGLSKLVETFNYRLRHCIQKLLEDRNALRKARKKMGFQYFEPRWLTNSIHI